MGWSFVRRFSVFCYEKVCLAEHLSPSSCAEQVLGDPFFLPFSVKIHRLSIFLRFFDHSRI